MELWKRNNPIKNPYNQANFAKTKGGGSKSQYRFFPLTFANFSAVLASVFSNYNQLDVTK